MTLSLSQIIARDSFFDINIPSEGFYEVWIKIENGKVVHLRPTPDLREQDKKRGKKIPNKWLSETCLDLSKRP